MAFASGMAAINTVMNLFASGTHVICNNDVYGGTYRLFTQLYEDYQLSFEFVDATDVENIRKAIKRNTKLIFIETPSNPLLKIIDIQKVAEIAKEKDLLLVVDNTLPPTISNSLLNRCGPGCA